MNHSVYAQKSIDQLVNKYKPAPVDIFKRAGWSNELLRQQIQGFKKETHQNITYTPRIYKDPKRTYITQFTTFPNQTRRYSLDIGVHYDLDIGWFLLKSVLSIMQILAIVYFEFFNTF